MASIDLKPVSDETIVEMGYSKSDLWLVKVDAVVFGPFETQSLKHYSAENSSLFVEATACVVDSQTWTPFFEIELFQRRLDSAEQAQVEGPFWILVDGQKSAPLSKHDLEKKLEMGIIARTDLFSSDDGHSWQKLYLIPSFDRRLKADELPEFPDETSFERSKLNVVEKMEHSHSQQDGLASLAYLGQKKDKTVLLNLDEITIKTIQETDVQRSLKWAIPAMFGCVLMMAVTGYYFISPKADAPLADVAEETEDKDAKREVIMPKIQFTQNATPVAERIGPSEDMPARRPASVAPLRSFRSKMIHPRTTHESEFPTHIETHAVERAPSNEPEMQSEPVEPDLPQEPTREEHNLVNTPNDDKSLDSEMNREPASQDPAIDPPVIEESTDF